MTPWIQASASWLFFCAVLAGVQVGAEETGTQQSAKVKVELWMAEVDLTKLRALEATSEYLDENSQPRIVKIADIFEGREQDAPLLQRPDELLAVLCRAGVARVLASPKLVTLNGRKASLNVGGTKVEVTPQTENEHE